MTHDMLTLSSSFVFVGILFVPVLLQIPPSTRLRRRDGSKGSRFLTGLNFELYEVLSLVRFVMTFAELLTPLYLDYVDLVSSTGARAVTGLGGRPRAEGGLI